MVQFITPTDITPGTADAWTDVDVSSHVSGSATGVILQIENADLSLTRNVGWRNNGSSDTRTNSFASSSHTWAVVGIDSNAIFEAYVDDTTDVTIYLHGYYEGDASFFTNGVDKSLGSTGSWTDIDISSDTGGDTSIGAIFEVISSGTIQQYGMRMNGSTDGRVRDLATRSHCSFTVGVDGNEVLEGQINSTSVDFFLLGYIVSDSTFHTNGSSLQTFTESSDNWKDMDALSSGASGGYIEVHDPNSGNSMGWGLRKNGSSVNITPQDRSKNVAIVEADSNRIVEGYGGTSSGQEYYEIGYTSVVTDFSKTLTDSTDLSDTFTLTTTKVTSDSLSISDIHSLSTTKSVSDSLTSSDLSTKSTTTSKTDSLGMSDSEIISVTKVLQDSADAQDSLVRSITSILSDVVSLNDTINRTTTIIKTDTHTLSDSTTPLQTKVLSDTITMSDASPRNVTQVISDVLTNADSLTKTTNTTSNDTLSISDVRELLITISKSDSLTLSDTFSTSKSILKTLTDSTSLSDTVVRSTTYILTDTITVLDNSPRSITQVISDSVTQADSLNRTTTALKQDTLSISDIHEVVVTIIRTDEISLLDSVSNSITFTRTFSDSTSMSDSLLNTITSIRSDTLSLSDSYQGTPVKVTTDTITPVDSIIRYITVTYTDSPQISDVANKKKIVTIDDIVSISDTRSTSAKNTFATTLSDTISLDDPVFVVDTSKDKYEVFATVLDDIKLTTKQT